MDRYLNIYYINIRYEIQNHNLEIMSNENLIEEIRPSYLLSADPVTHVQPNYQNKKMDNQNLYFSLK
jgi:aspartyl aminopeptidase